MGSKLPDLTHKPDVSRRIRRELRGALTRYRFSHFITLATNGADFSYPRMRSLLRNWDARVNRELNGSRWSQREDERLLWFAFLEKPEVNPHWHLLVEVDPCIQSPARQERYDRFDTIAKKNWFRLYPPGTCDVEAIESKRIIDYVTKVIDRDDNYDRFVLSREFQTTR